MYISPRFSGQENSEFSLVHSPCRYSPSHLSQGLSDISLESEDSRAALRLRGFTSCWWPPQSASKTPSFELHFARYCMGVSVAAPLLCSVACLFSRCIPLFIDLRRSPRTLSQYETILSFTWVKCARALKLRQVNLGPRLSKKLGTASVSVVEFFLLSVFHRSQLNPMVARPGVIDSPTGRPGPVGNA